MLQVQFDLFEDNYSDTQLLRKEFLAVKTAGDNVRRGVFARLNESGKLIMAQGQKLEELEKRLAMIERNI